MELQFNGRLLIEDATQEKIDKAFDLLCSTFYNKNAQLDKISIDTFGTVTIPEIEADEDFVERLELFVVDSCEEGILFVGEIEMYSTEEDDHCVRLLVVNGRVKRLEHDDPDFYVSNESLKVIGVAARKNQLFSLMEDVIASPDEIKKDDMYCDFYTLVPKSEYPEGLKKALGDTRLEYATFDKAYNVMCELNVATKELFGKPICFRLEKTSISRINGGEFVRTEPVWN